MNLIQQAVERAGHMEREGKVVARPLPPMTPLPNLGHLQSRSFRPAPMRKNRMPLAAMGLALGAMLAGAGLYAALVHSHGEGTAVAASPPAARVHTVTAAPAAAAVAAAPVVTAAAKPVPIAAPTDAGAATTPAAAATTAAVPATLVAAAAPVPTLVPPSTPTTATAATLTSVAPEPLVDAKATVESWARAWSTRDVAAYLAFYGDEFVPESGAARPDWEKSRRQMIERRRHIVVSVNDLQFDQLRADRVVARYRQDYAADAYRETGTRKRLVLARESGQWRIVAEAIEATDAAGGHSL